MVDDYVRLYEEMIPSNATDAEEPAAEVPGASAA
jgi:hypothetical protein